MKFALIVATAALIVSPEAQQQARPSATRVAIDKLRAEMTTPLAELAVLDASDRTLAISNQAQSDTSVMLERLKRKIEAEDASALTRKGDALNARIRAYFASGCPQFEAVVPKDVYDRCNPPRAGMRAELEALAKEEAALMAQLADIASTRRAVSDTTLANVAKQRANAARREELEAIKAAQATRLRKLYLSGIADVVSRTDLRGKAIAACDAMPKLEESVCCHQVAVDGRNPALCNVPLIVQAFEKAGIFGSTIVK